MKISINPSTLKGEIYAPPSKSYAHRLLICAALAKGGSEVKGISGSEDMIATLSCMEALGAGCAKTGTDVKVTGIEKKVGTVPVLNCNESGSTLRFFIPIALAFYDEAVLRGTERLIQRGVGIYEDMLADTAFEKDATSITVKGRLKSGDYTMRGDVSSQFASGMLFALPLLEGDSTLTITEPVESRAYIDITIDALRTFGIEIIQKEKNTFFIKGNQAYQACSATVEGDWSNAAFLYAFNAVGAQLDIKGLNSHSFQGDKACVEMFNALENPEGTIDISDCPDLGPVLFATAAVKQGKTFTGTARLRIKESDRAMSMAQELKKFGIDCDVEENSVTVKPGTLTAPTETLSGHNDHRIVMSLSVLTSLTGGEIQGAEAVRKSWPNFFTETGKLGLNVEEIR